MSCHGFTTTKTAILFTRQEVMWVMMRKNQQEPTIQNGNTHKR